MMALPKMADIVIKPVAVAMAEAGTPYRGVLWRWSDADRRWPKGD